LNVVIEAGMNSAANPKKLKIQLHCLPDSSAVTDVQREILSAAANCFEEQGFAATSIDDVARRLSATKGMIYHHFRSKTDLFFEVYRRGMELNFAAIRPHAEGSGSALIRLAKMSFAHSIVLMVEQAFQRVLMQGVLMHQQGATTAAQRETLEELIDNRNAYESVFREAIEATADELNLNISDSSLASKSYLAVLNSTVNWYTPRDADSENERMSITRDLVAYALRGIGAEMPSEDLIRLEKTEIGKE